MNKLVIELQNDPDWLAVLAEYLRRMKSGYYDQKMIDVIFQRWDGDYMLNLGDIYAFACIHSWINAGKIAIASLQMGTEPHHDRSSNVNETLIPTCLARLNLHSAHGIVGQGIWSGEFWGGKQDEDGVIEWKGEVFFETFDKGQSAGWQTVSAGQLPLEVGVTAASKTLLQLQTRGGVARWPYGHSEITVLKVLEPKTLRSCLL